MTAPDFPLGGALGRDSLARLLDVPTPLIEGLRNREAQLQPNGIDLTLEQVWSLTNGGALGGPAPGRQLPERALMAPSVDGWYRLPPGAYVVSIHEWLQIPTNVMALARPRSSLLRMGAQLHTAVWDAGYVGRSEALLVVHNSFGIELAQDVAICQIVFFSLTETVEGYRGTYQGR